jgi:transcriptional regulator with XRE-family HTH domain
MSNDETSAGTPVAAARFFGAIIQKYRKNHQISQDDLATACGINRSTLGRYEGGLPPSWAGLLRLRMGMGSVAFRQAIEYAFDKAVEMSQEQAARALAPTFAPEPTPAPNFTVTNHTPTEWDVPE